MRFAPCLAAAALLTACGAVSLGTLTRLSALSPLTADPADMAVAVDLPEGVGIRPGSARLTFEVTRGAESVSRVMVLAGAPETGLSVAPEDLAPLAEAQALARDWKAVDPDGTSGILSLTFDPCRDGDLAAEATVSAAIRLEEDGPFLPLLRGVSVAEVSGLPDPADLPECAAVPQRP